MQVLAHNLASQFTNRQLNITTDNVLDFIESLKLYTVDSLVEFMNTFLEFLTNFSINSIYKKDEKNEPPLDTQPRGFLTPWVL